MIVAPGYAREAPPADESRYGGTTGVAWITVGLLVSQVLVLGLLVVLLVGLLADPVFVPVARFAPGGTPFVLRENTRSMQ